MILPCEDNLLRRITLERHAFRVGRYDNLPRDIERALVEVIERELDLQRRLEILKRELEIRYDYSTYAAFRAIDKYNEGTVNTYNLSVFLKSNGHYATEKELLCIIRRIDTDGDAKLNYAEFSEFIRSQEPRAVVEDLKSRSFSAERSGFRNLTASNFSSPSRSVYVANNRSHSAYGRRTQINTPLRDSTMRESRMSPLKESLLRSSSPSRKLQ